LGTMAEGSKLGDPRPARDFHYSDHCFPACIGRFGHTKVARIILICAIFYGVPAGSNHQSAGVPEPGLMGRRQKFACQGLRTLWRRPSWVRIPPPAPEFALPIRTASFVWRIGERIRVALHGSRRSLEASLGNGSATGLGVREKEDPRKPRRGVMQSGCGGVRYGHVHARARGHRLWGPRGSRMLQLDHLRLSSLPSN